ncbi:ATP-binding cassette domain-containing protein [Virgibacillus sp. W0430]|uniref:ABC transporter ATP-binding protein n=1 Tax=Virgibacillus sp. W0430 TaxID=3391580 RepID=UPI003F44AE86
MFKLENVIVENVLKIDYLEINKPITCIVGQSGSGKSTLLRLLNQLDDPLEGNIYFEGESIDQIDPLELRKKIPMTPQAPVIFDGTVRDNLLTGLTFSGADFPPDKKLMLMLELLKLDTQLHTDASNLSGGEKQRLALGRILLMDKAKAILLDEPSSSLDDKTAWRVMKDIAAYAKEKMIKIIMVTHDNELKNKLADDVIVMDTYRIND